MFTLTYNVNSGIHRRMKKEEVDAFFAWFMESMPAAIDELSTSVKATEGFVDWQADNTPESLLRLGDWYEMQVRTRPYTPQETEHMEKISHFDENRPIAFEPWTLSGETLFIGIKVGMYLGEVFRRSMPSMKWRPCKLVYGRNKNPNADYGQPVLDDQKVNHFNPCRITQVVASGVAIKTKTGGDLYRTFLYNVNIRENILKQKVFTQISPYRTRALDGTAASPIK